MKKKNSELVTNKTTCFKIAPNTNNIVQEANFIDQEATIDSINLDCLNFDDDDDDDDPGNLGKTPFQKLAFKMVNMTDDGFIKKKVTL